LSLTNLDLSFFRDDGEGLRQRVNALYERICGSCRDHYPQAYDESATVTLGTWRWDREIGDYNSPDCGHAVLFDEPDFGGSFLVPPFYKRKDIVEQQSLAAPQSSTEDEEHHIVQQSDDEKKEARRPKMMCTIK